MPCTNVTIAVSLCFCLAIILSGFWLSRSGKPFNTALLTIHKLVSLAAGILLAVALYRSGRAAELSMAGLAAGLLAGLSFLAAGVSGGLLSTGKPVPAVVLRVHQVTLVLTVVTTAATLYLLLDST